MGAMGGLPLICAADLQIKFTVHSPGRGMGMGRFLISGSGSCPQLASAAENIKNVPLALVKKSELDLLASLW